jgi:uncharacterized LabA/DUF88 family protein
MSDNNPSADVIRIIQRMCGNDNHTAFFLDLENLYFSPSLKLVAIRTNRYDYIFEIIESAIAYIKEKFKSNVLDSIAYCDLEKLTHCPLGEFYLANILMKNVYGSEHKNTSDMQLCVDALEINFMKPTTKYFVIFSGDRDYIPLIQALKKYNKTVFIVAFKDSISGDLVKMLNSNNIIYAEDLLSEEKRNKLAEYHAFAVEKEKERSEKEKQRVEEKTTNMGWAQVVKQNNQNEDQKMQQNNECKNSTSKNNNTKNTGPVKTNINAEICKSQWRSLSPDDQSGWAALKVVLTMQQELRAKEIWLTPYLRRLTEKLPTVSATTRKGLIANLEKNGIITITESQLGEGNKFSVIITNDNHPDVIHLQKEHAKKCERLEALQKMKETDDFEETQETHDNDDLDIQEFPKENSTDSLPEATPFVAVSRNPPVSVDQLSYDDLANIFIQCFYSNEIWVRASEIGVRFKGITDHNFRDTKLVAVDKGIIKTRGVGGNHEICLCHSR